MPFVRALRVSLFLLFVALVVQGRATAAQSAASIDAKCRPYFHQACSEALGEWLPIFGHSTEWWQAGEAAAIKKRDGFVYENERPRAPELLGFDGPDDGTFFVYGLAGPPSGHVVYDRDHHIAFYQQGCCSWHDVVAAASVPPPPKPVVLRNLTHLVTVRGIRLGMTSSQVMDIYGATKLLPVAQHKGVGVLAYTTWPPFKTLTTVRSPCGQMQNFFFRKDRLILIQLGNGC